jgi:hypothetical protein
MMSLKLELRCICRTPDMHGTMAAIMMVRLTCLIGLWAAPACKASIRPAAYNWLHTCRTAQPRSRILARLLACDQQWSRKCWTM